jgi:Family of unknown function (DUF6114)
VTSADAAHRRSGALARGWRNFRRWRRGRPFWAGLFVILAALLIYGSSQLTLSGFQLKIGVEGFLTYVIPLVLGLCGLLIWFTPQQRVFYGVIAAALALYSLIAVNFGGFFLGMLFGIIGGSLAVAWTPVQPVPPAEDVTEPGGSPAEAGAKADQPVQPEATVDDLFTGPLTDVLPRPVNPLTEPVGPPRDLDDTQHIPVQRGDEEQAPEEQPPPDRDNGTGPLPRRTPRLFVITLVPLLLTAFVIAGVRGGTPARAEPTTPYPSACPTTTKSASAKPSKSPKSSASKSPATEPEPAEVTKGPATTPSPAASPSPSPTSTEDSGSGLIGGVIDGIGDLLGIGEDGTPSASPTPSGSPTPTSSPAAGGGTSTGTGQTPKPEATPSSAKPTKSATATPKPTSSADCVVVDPKEHTSDGVPTVQKVPDRMRGSTLTLEGFAFDGVTELDTAGGGNIRVLEFSMTKAVTENFELLVPGSGKHTMSLKSSALTVQQADKDGRRVKFYCSEFTGKLVLDVLGVPFEVPIKLTFTPDFPPPITFNKMVFNDIDIQLVFVDADVLKAPNLNTKVLSS